MGSGLKAPEPLIGIFTRVTGTLVLTFDQPLEANPALNLANWFLRADNQQQPVATAAALGTDVTITAGLPFVDVGPDVVRYSPPPFDLAGANGLDVPLFPDFPITVVP